MSHDRHSWEFVMEHLLTPEEVAKAVGLPVKTLYAWRAKGYGPPSARIGRHVRYRAEDVRAFIDQRFAEDGDGSDG
jgi:excisionase family DNA binding protein